MPPTQSAEARRALTRRLGLGLMLPLVFCLGVDPRPAAGRENPSTRAWLLRELEQSVEETPPDLCRISSMLYGLTRGGATGPSTEEVLNRAARRLEHTDPTRLDCPQLVDLAFISHFLSLSAPELDKSATEQGLRACLTQRTDAFSLASSLFYLCHFGEKGPAAEMAGALAALVSMQGPDGSFGGGDGSPLARFYLTTHAVFALHACGADPEAVRRGQAYLLAILPRLRRSGFLDGLIETLLMLHKMEVAVPGTEDYLALIRERTRTDGGICSFDYPGCLADWHATSLLLELQHTFSEAPP